ncbi:MAG: PilZ domain-containing protein [Pseudolabrys sp.]
MRGDKRKARRHRMRFDAWLVLEDGERCDCTLSDISHIGARINIPDSEAIPANFVLFLAVNGSARRRCRVIWRKPRELGVKFETWLDDRIKATLVPKSGAAAPSKEAEPAETSA